MRRVVPLFRSAWLALAIALFAVAWTARPPGDLAAGKHIAPLLPRVEVLRGLGAGYHELLADYFWIETLQAVTAATTPAESRDIYDYAKLVAALDPMFRPIYVFAGVTIPAKDDQGRWQNTRESTELLELGVQHFPKYVYLRILLAYNLVTYERAYGRTAKLLDETSRLQGAPSYLPGLATRLYTQAGDYSSGLMLAKTLAQSADDDATRSAFQRRVKEIELEEILRRLDSAISAFRVRQGRPPASFAELVASGLVPSIPRDPLGGQLVIGTDGRSHSTAAAKRLELNVEASP